jgi:hypothetical protein
MEMKKHRSWLVYPLYLFGGFALFGQPSSADFTKVVPYLTNPLVLAAFCLYLLAAVWRTLLASKILAPLSQRQSAAVQRSFLGKLCFLATLCIVLGFSYDAFQYFRVDHERITDSNAPPAPNTEEKRQGSESEPGARKRLVQISHGTQSPNVADVGGNVEIRFDAKPVGEGSIPKENDR